MHRIRGVLGTALTWAIVWLLVGLGVVLFLGEPNCLYCNPNWRLYFVLFWTLWGAISGAGFAIVLMIAERRHTFADLTVARTTMWGAVGAAAVPGVAMIWDVVANGFDSDVLADVRFVLITLAISAALGAACAAGTLRIARQSLTH